MDLHFSGLLVTGFSSYFFNELKHVEMCRIFSPAEFIFTRSIQMDEGSTGAV